MTNLIPTSFTDIRTGEISLGYRLYDDYESTYCNIMNLNDPTYQIPNDDLEFLNDAMEYLKGDNISKNMISDLKENQLGIFIGPTWYDYDKIKDYL